MAVGTVVPTVVVGMMGTTMGAGVALLAAGVALAASVVGDLLLGAVARLALAPLPAENLGAGTFCRRI